MVWLWSQIDLKHLIIGSVQVFLWILPIKKKIGTPIFADLILVSDYGCPLVMVCIQHQHVPFMRIRSNWTRPKSYQSRSG